MCIHTHAQHKHTCKSRKKRKMEDQVGRSLFTSSDGGRWHSFSRGPSPSKSSQFLHTRNLSQSGPARTHGDPLHGILPLLAASFLACWLLDAEEIFHGLKMVESGTAGQGRLLPVLSLSLYSQLPNNNTEKEVRCCHKTLPVPFTQDGCPGYPLLYVSAPKAADLKALLIVNDWSYFLTDLLSAANKG